MEPIANLDTLTPQAPRDRYWLHALLFFVTLASTTFSGGQWAGRSVLYERVGWIGFVVDGLAFSIPLLIFLTVHEFGHYFAARKHRVDASLPFYIPLPLIGIGTLGAVIRIRSMVPSMKKLFDIGAAGPIAGFVAAFAILIFALATLPSPSYVLDLGGHDDLKQHVIQNDAFPDTPPGVSDETTQVIVVGNTLLYRGLASLFPDVPPMYEMYHYPVLFAAWLGLFFTALNLLPVGQLDGGHITYSLFGERWHRFIARTFVVFLLFSGSVGFLVEKSAPSPAIRDAVGPFAWFLVAAVLYLYLLRIFRGDHRLIAPTLVGLIVAVVLTVQFERVAFSIGYSGWLIWSLLIITIIKVEHPPVAIEEPLTPGRRALGLFALLIFVLCFSAKPIYLM